MTAEIAHLLTADFDSRALLGSITERTRRTFKSAWRVLLLRATDSISVEIV
ncbi:hypothetical protein [Rhodococcus sp. MS16]|uniref:hypothetical protein n=1 Tax=Rhodococcus sp. MS16 TaxID=2579941 RepID=UPI001562C366|nr:hypothetical protein [Rhodococcus sp. MS16]